MNKIYVILVLLSFLHFIIPINYGDTIAKQFAMAMSTEEEHGASKSISVDEVHKKQFTQIKNYNFGSDYLHVITKEKIAHFILHVPTIDWLETFSTPPDLF